MGARGPPSSVSMAGYLQGGGSGGSGDPFRPRDRKSSAGNSGLSSREHSVEGRGGDNRRGVEARGSGDSGASYPNQYQGQGFDQNRRTSGQNWGYGRDRGKNRDLYWRDDSKGVHGRVQGVFYDDDGPTGIGESSTRGYSLTIAGESEGRRPSSTHRRQENSIGDHRRQSNAFERQEISVGDNRKQANGFEMQENSVGDNRKQSNDFERQEIGVDDNRRQSNGFERQENGHSANQRQANAQGGFEGPGGYRRAPQSGSFRGRAPSAERRGAAAVASASRLLPGRDLVVAKDGAYGDARELGTFGSAGTVSRSKEIVFGSGKELQTFGSPRTSFSRNINSPGPITPGEDPKRRWGNSDAENGRDVGGVSFKGLREGDLRKNFAEESVGQGDGWRSTSSTSSNGSKNGNRIRTHTAMRREGITAITDHGEDADRIGGSERGLSYNRNNSGERVSDSPGEMATLSPSLSSKKAFSRKNSYDRMKKREASDQLPVFSPSSEATSDILRGTSIDVLSRGSSSRMSRESSARMSRENSAKLSPEGSVSDSVSRDAGLDGSEGLDEVKELPVTASESASAGMHRTRSTDWYEICLKEEEEEEMQALARKREAESRPASSQKSIPVGVRNFGRSGSSNQKRGESAVFSPRSGAGANYREARNLEKGWSHERVVRGDAADSAQQNFPSGQRDADGGGKQGLFTPWNALQAVPASRNGSLNAVRSKPVDPQRDSLLKHENLRVSLAGGRQEARGRSSFSSVDADEAENWRGRRSVSSIDPDEAENWRARRSVSSIDPDEAENWRAERRPSRDYSRDVVVRADPPRESISGPPGRAAPKHTNGRKEAPPASSVVETEKREPEVLPNIVNGSTVRPATFYRALHEATAGDEEPLPHVVGTCADMCPGKERSQRERLRDLAVFERVSGDMRKTSKDLAVKKFCRTVVASELESTDVRPLPVLWRTQQYLLGLLDDPEFSFNIVHNFLFDRTRAIRQELGMQRILDHQSVTIHEEIVRFHILSEHELRDLNRRRSKQVDTHLNLEQLSKSLYSLVNLYISLGGKDGAHFENEAEFHAYYVLLNLGNHGRFQAEPLSLWFPNVPAYVLEGAPMQFARKALRFYRSDNFIGFFRLVREATYLQACLLELNFDAVRAMALAMLNVAEYKLHPYPLSDLAQQLILEQNEVDELCMYYGLLTGLDSASQKPCLLAKQGQFSLPEKENLPRHSCPLIGSKRAESFYLEVKGGSKVIKEVKGCRVE